MSAIKIYEEDGDGTYIIFGFNDVEFVNPIKYYADHYINSRITMRAEMILLAYKNAHPEEYKKLVKKDKEDAKQLFILEAEKAWKDHFESARATVLPENLTMLLHADSKKEQVRLLKGLTISAIELFAFILTSSIEHGYTFSEYKSRHYHNGFDAYYLPKLAYLSDGVVNTIGKTILSQGQLKDVLKYRRVMIAKFFDKGNDWHCIFITYKSLMGKETWKDGKPHFHYISSKFGMSREAVLQQLKSKKYSFSSLPHIDLNK